VPWPPWSQDLTTPNFFLLEYLNGKVCSNQAADSDELKVRISEETVGYEVLTEVVMKSSVSSDILPCSLSQLAFWRNMSFLSSGPKNKPKKKPV
jgi:hypothetical protein